MPGTSSFLSSESGIKARGESRFYRWFGVLLLAAGLLLLMLPALRRGAAEAFAASWLLFAGAILALIRPLVFRRGLPDFVFGLISAALYLLSGYVAGGGSLISVEGFRLGLGALLLFAGLSRLLVFARMLSVSALPMQLICCLFDVAAAFALFWGFPSGRAFMPLWYAGMVVLSDGAEALTETLVLARLLHGRTAS